MENNKKKQPSANQKKVNESSKSKTKTVAENTKKEDKNLTVTEPNLDIVADDQKTTNLVEESLPTLDTPPIPEEFELEEQSPRLSRKISVFFSKLFSKKSKGKDSQKFEPIEGKKKQQLENKKLSKNTFLTFLITIVLTAVVTFSATLIGQAIVEKNKTEARLKEEALLKETLLTVYQIGNQNVPSFEYYVGGESPISIIDQRSRSTQEVRYNFEYTDTKELLSDMSDYIEVLKSFDFFLLDENPPKYIRQKDKVFISATFNQGVSSSGEGFVLSIIFNRTI